VNLKLKDEATQSLIERVSSAVHQRTGVQLGSNQNAMVYFRIRKRMTDLGYEHSEEYLDHFEEQQDSEMPILISLLTTHHTYFFREFTQFEHLESEILPELIQRLKQENRTTLRIWSAACSRGQEVYSLAMFLSYHLQKLTPEVKFEILGSDVDAESVRVAETGVFRWDDIKEIPAIYLQNFWARGTGEIQDFVKVKSNLKAHCRFETLNLFEVKPARWAQKFDLVFCRNVFIYFSPSQISDITRTLMNCLHPDGRLYIGVSESLNGLSLPIKLCGPSVYRHQDVAKPVSTGSPKPSETPVRTTREPLRVLCVDDSPTVLTLLKRILSTEHGFHVAGTALNGLEAEKAIAREKFDVITLDIHMPEKNGVEFLQAMKGKACPPVVVVSSVSRDDAETGLRMLELGARDYVEKPSMQELNARADEIRMKVKLAAKNAVGPQDHQLDKSFQRNLVIKNPEAALRIIVAGYGRRLDIKKLIDKFKGSGQEPPILLLLHGAANLYDAIVQDLSSLTGRVIEPKTDSTEMEVNHIYAEYFSNATKLPNYSLEYMLSAMVLGDLSEPMANHLKEIQNMHLLVEDLGDYQTPSYVLLRLAAARTVPVTSFDYHSNHYLAGGRL
jgi:chemotaxis protein methyltransferase CheR